MVRIAVVCEASGDFRTIKSLVRDLLCSRVEWLRGAPEMWEAMAEYCGLLRGSSYTTWTHRPASGWPQRRAHGKFLGEPGAPMALAARRMLLELFSHAGGQPEVVILAKDGDQQGPHRRRGLEQARSDKPWTAPIIIAVADPEREAWVISGFSPRDARERDALEAATRRLGFDPTTHSERLTSKTAGDPRDAKRVAEELGIDADRETPCLGDLDLLARRGMANGLSPFLDEVQARLVPLVAGRP